MDKFYLEKPSIKRKDEIIEYMNEFDLNNSEIHGDGGLDKILEGYSAEEVIYEVNKMQDEDFAKSLNMCPSKTFLLIRENDNKIVGISNIRWNLSKELLEFAGHIGYGIRPVERRKGYSKISLYLSLVEAQKMGLEEVVLGCTTTNIASNKTILALGGILDHTGIDVSDNILSNAYVINVNDSIKNYKNQFDKYIK